jgi:hypothetical protein
MIRRKFLIALLLVLIAGRGFGLPSGQTSAPPVPDEFAKLYKMLDGQLGVVERHLAALSTPDRKAADTVFTAELLAANANRGEELLAPRVLQSTFLWIRRLKEMGFGGVWMSLMYPILDPKTPRQPEFVEFYKKVVAGARAQGLAVCLDMGTFFDTPVFSKMRPDYRGMTLEAFAAGMHDMAALVLRELAPDYLGILNEPDTQSRNTGVDLTPANFEAFAKTVLAGLDKGRTKLGIGAGTWSPPAYFEAIARRIPVDVIDLHIYPIIRDYMTGRIEAAVRLAVENGKGLVIGESWLYKADAGEMGGNIATAAEIFRRDVFDFWTPLDTRFIAAVMKLARTRGASYANVFWSRNFFGDVPYGPETRALPPEQAFAQLTQRAAPNVLNGGLTRLGTAVKKLLAERDTR